MTDAPTERPSFNAVTDRWLPLLGADGKPAWASPVEVLCGAKDAPDLDYPRDDFRIYARLLLSALAQALVPARTKAELAQRIERPLARAELEARLAPVLGDFDLFGPEPFLQVLPPEKPPAKDVGGATFVFVKREDLYPPPVAVDAISLPIALVALFIEQMYAGGAGRGYRAGPGGQPGALTLVDPGSVRRAAWANTLALDAVAQKYADDEPRPWSNATRSARPRAAIGLVGGLFFQPRSVWLIPAGVGTCSFSGSVGPLVRLSPLLPKSELTKKVAGVEDLWQHPCAPLAVNSQGIAPIRLNTQRPAWTGLAQLLAPLSRGKQKEHPSEGPAPVLQQWKDLGLKSKRPRLLVLDFDRDKAIVRRRFFEAFPLTEHLVGNRDLVERLRALVDDAQILERALVKALVQAHDDRKQGGLALADAEASFWLSSEAPFLDWLAAVAGAEVWDVAAERQVDAARSRMEAALRRTAIGVFNAHVAVSEFDPSKQARVAKARRRLLKSLYPSVPSAAPVAATTREVTP